MLDPALHSAIAKGLEHSINHALQYDPGSQAAVRKLHGQCLAIHCLAPQISCYFWFWENQVNVASYREQPANCSLSGSLHNLTALLWREPYSLANTGVQIQGDVALLGQLQSLVQQLDIDWEEALNRGLGDTLGHPIAEWLRHQWSWLQTRAKELPEWLPQYLSEEIAVIPSAQELTYFYRDISTLRTETERLEARIASLRQQWQNRKNAPNLPVQEPHP